MRTYKTNGLTKDSPYYQLYKIELTTTDVFSPGLARDFVTVYRHLVDWY